MAPRIFFRVPLTCPHCGTLNDARSIKLSSAMGANAIWSFVEPGGVLDVGPDDLPDAFLYLRRPEGNTRSVIEMWTCQSCCLFSPARLVFRVRTPYVLEFVRASVATLTTETLASTDFMTPQIEEWASEPGEDEAWIEELKQRERRERH